MGIHQGDPLSPLCLNVVLHRAHDAPLEALMEHPPWFRYADNLAYLCRGVPEGRRALDTARGLLAGVGLALPGEDGPPVDLRRGKARLLGFDLTWRGDRLELNSGKSAFAALNQRLDEAHLWPNPPEAARRVVDGWIGSMGPALASDKGDRTIAQVDTILRRHGFREITIAELGRLVSLSWERWRDYRHLSLGSGAKGSVDSSLMVLGPPAPNFLPGAPTRASEAAAG